MPSCPPPPHPSSYQCRHIDVGGLLLNMKYQYYWPNFSSNTQSSLLMTFKFIILKNFIQTLQFMQIYSPKFIETFYDVIYHTSPQFTIHVSNEWLTGDSYSLNNKIFVGSNEICYIPIIEKKILKKICKFFFKISEFFKKLYLKK